MNEQNKIVIHTSEGPFGAGWSFFCVPDFLSIPSFGGEGVLVCEELSCFFGVDVRVDVGVDAGVDLGDLLMLLCLTLEDFSSSTSSLSGEAMDSQSSLLTSSSLSCFPAFFFPFLLSFFFGVFSVSFCLLLDVFPTSVFFSVVVAFTCNSCWEFIKSPNSSSSSSSSSACWCPHLPHLLCLPLFQNVVHHRHPSYL